MINEILAESDVQDILKKALNSERLTLEDGIRLLESDDIHAIGAAADVIRKKHNGNNTFYIVNRHINYTDICENQCKFCAYSRQINCSDGKTMSVDEIVQQAVSEYERIKYTELHIVGGLNPSLSIDYYENMLSSLKKALPNIHLQAFTAVEIAYISKVSDLPVRDTLTILKNAGLGSIPGGGAEIFSKRVRDIICPEKISGDEWLSVLETAHNLGIKSNSTMLYGHVETNEEIIDHMIKIRKLQDKTNGFMAFIPLKFHSGNNKLGVYKLKNSTIDDLKLFAVSRLMLDNIPHIKVFWIMLGLKFAQIALSYGADDIDGTVVEEKIVHRAGANTPEGLTVSNLRDIIIETGTVPVERDTIYNEVTRDEAGLPAISKC